MADESTETVDAPSIDMEAASDQIGASLFPETAPTDGVAGGPDESVTTETSAEQNSSATPASPKTLQPVAQATDQTAPTAPAPLPKSWKSDMGETWNKIPPEAQQYYLKREKDMLDGLEQYKGAAEYGKAFHQALVPYQSTLQAQGVDAPRAVQVLLEAHAMLTTGTTEQRQAAYADLGRRLNLPPVTATSGTTDGTVMPQLDPRIQTLQSQLQQIQQVMTAREQAELNTARTKAGAEVNAFATATNKDGTPTNAFFDEVHEDIARFLTTPGVSLQEAYDKAVWANPVTREKQKLSYFQTESEKQRERARLDALPKQKARGVNVNGRETQRTPTEPLGSMDDTLRATLKEIKERTVH